MAIEVGHGVAIREDEVRESFLRASGPGGQNVNKLETAVQLRFDARNSSGLPEPVRARLREAAAPPPPKRRATRPTLGSEVRRLEGKARRAGVKRLRGRPQGE